jgi:hypothetical protein
LRLSEGTGKGPRQRDPEGAQRARRARQSASWSWHAAASAWKHRAARANTRVATSRGASRRDARLRRARTRIACPRPRGLRSPLLYASWHRTSLSMLLGRDDCWCFVLWGQASPLVDRNWIGIDRREPGMARRASRVRWGPGTPGHRCDAARWGRYWAARIDARPADCGASPRWS